MIYLYKPKRETTMAGWISFILLICIFHFIFTLCFYIYFMAHKKIIEENIDVLNENMNAMNNFDCNMKIIK